MDAKNNSLREFIQRHWRPKPITPPVVDPDLENLTGVQRSAEVIRYSLCSLEWWLSPLGRLREWARLNSGLCLILLIPAVLVLPLITWIIYLVAGWIAMLVAIAGNLILLPLAVLLAAGAIWLAVAVLRAALST